MLICKSIYEACRYCETKFSGNMYTLLFPDSYGLYCKDCAIRLAGEYLEFNRRMAILKKLSRPNLFRVQVYKRMTTEPSKWWTVKLALQSKQVNDDSCHEYDLLDDLQLEAVRFKLQEGRKDAVEVRAKRNKLKDRERFNERCAFIHNLAKELEVAFCHKVRYGVNLEDSEFHLYVDSKYVRLKATKRNFNKIYKSIMLEKKFNDERSKLFR